MTEKLRNCKTASLDLKTGYARLLSQGFDGLAECFNVEVPKDLLDSLDAAKARAKENARDGEGLEDFQLGSMTLQVAAHGAKGGAAYLLKWPDHLSIRINAGRAWGVVVEYEPAALWQIGVEEMRTKVAVLMHSQFNPVRPPFLEEGEQLLTEHYTRLAKAHYCFDFFSPCFSEEMRPEIWHRVIQHSSSKKKANGTGGDHQEMWGRAGYIETLTLGSKAGLQIQVYDKGKHISEKTGNTWFLEVWDRSGRVPMSQLQPLKDIWRLEVRFAGKWLKDRNVNTFEEFTTCAPLLFTEALRTKRLATTDSKDGNMRRRAMHPLWSEAYVAAEAGNHMLPIGRRRTLAAEAYQDMLRKNIAGCARTAAVLAGGNGRVTENEMIGFVVVAATDAYNDPAHLEKTEHRRHVYRRQIQSRCA